MINIDLSKSGTKYTPFWKTCVGAGRANEALRAGFQRQLKKIQDNIGFQYLRFHGLFHDDMFVIRRDRNGDLIYNFQYIDELFDFLMEMSIRPFVELGFFPECLKGGNATQFHWKANVTPPPEWDAWCALVQKAILHWQDRYGADEVRRWYFEIWNEPNLDGFWDGTKSQYFSMYAATVKTIKAIDPELRVGGPATSNFVPDDRFAGEREDAGKQLTHRVRDLDSLQWHGVWIEDFLTFCAKNGLPVDFVSTHPYPTDFAIDTSGNTTGRSRGILSTRQDMAWLNEAVRKSAYPDAEIHLTEWSSSPSSRDCTHDFLQEATFIVKCNLDCIGLADSLSYWTFTDIFEENGAGDSIFHGGFGLINYQGIVKPGYHAYRMLSQLGNECVYRDDQAFFTRQEGKLRAILYHYPVKETICMSPYPDRKKAFEEMEKGEAYRVAFRIQGLKPDAYIQAETLDHDHGWALPAWLAMGSPEPPSREQTAALQKAAEQMDMSVLQADQEGNLLFEREISPWSVLLLKEI